MIKPEHYNEYGEIVKPPEPPRPYTRTMTGHDLHRIHDTKDLFEGDCTYCQDTAKRKTFYVCSKCKTDCYTRLGLDNHWLEEH